MIRFLSGTIAILAVLAAAILIEGGNPLAYLAAVPLGLSLLIPLFAVLAVWEFGDWIQAWKDALAGEGTPGKGSDSVAIWAFSEKAAFAGGIIGFTAGLILMLSNLREVSQMGRSLAMGLLSPLYALLIGLVCRILRARIEKRMARSY